MPLEEQIELCSKHFQKWKSLALSNTDSEKTRRYMEKAFFWLELQTAFTTLFVIEQTKGNDPETKRKLLIAKSNLSKKLADYADNTLNEINL